MVLRPVAFDEREVHQRAPRTSRTPFGALLGAAHRHRAIALTTIVLSAWAVPSAMWELWPRGREAAPRRAAPDARYATQARSGDTARRAHITQRAAEAVDSAVETCAGLGVRSLALKYRMPPDPPSLAGRFASSYEAAYRRDVYRGCLEGLYHGG